MRKIINLLRYDGATATLVHRERGNRPDGSAIWSISLMKTPGGRFFLYTRGTPEDPADDGNAAAGTQDIKALSNADACDWLQAFAPAKVAAAFGSLVTDA